jgi:RNA polymerase sigma factor (sigma-70 family)
MTAAEIYKKARKLAWCVTRSSEVVEGFPPYAVIRFLQKPEGSRILLRYLLVDYIREDKGRTKVKKRQREMVDYPVDLLYSRSDTHEIIEVDEVINAVRRSLKPRERQMFEMMLEGYSFPEIGKRFNMTQSRISQIYSRLIIPKLELFRSI